MLFFSAVPQFLQTAGLQRNRPLHSMVMSRILTATRGYVFCLHPSPRRPTVGLSSAFRRGLSIPVVSWILTATRGPVESLDLSPSPVTTPCTQALSLASRLPPIRSASRPPSCLSSSVIRSLLFPSLPFCSTRCFL